MNGVILWIDVKGIISGSFRTTVILYYAIIRGILCQVIPDFGILHSLFPQLTSLQTKFIPVEALVKFLSDLYMLSIALLRFWHLLLITISNISLTAIKTRTEFLCIDWFLTLLCNALQVSTEPTKLHILHWTVHSLIFFWHSIMDHKRIPLNLPSSETLATFCLTCSLPIVCMDTS